MNQSVSALAPLPFRHLIVFLTFSVILATLVGGGLSLPFVVRALRIGDADAEEREDLRRGIAGMSQAALAKIQELEDASSIDAFHARSLRRRYERLRERASEPAGDERGRIDAESAVLDAERNALIEMRERGEIDNTVLRRLLRNLDSAEERLGDLGAGS